MKNALFLSWLLVACQPPQPAATSPSTVELTRADAFIASMIAAGRAPGWVGATVTSRQVLYAPGDRSPSLTLVELSSGYLVMNEATRRVPEWSDGAASPLSRVVDGARALGKTPARFYFVGPLDLVAEDDAGQLIGHEQATLVAPLNGLPPMPWADYKNALSKTTLAPELASDPGDGTGPAPNPGGPIITHCGLVGSTHSANYQVDVDTSWWPAYRQLQPYEGPNRYNHYSGCGPTAWLIAIGWAQHQGTVNGGAWSVGTNMLGGQVPNDVLDGVLGTALMLIHDYVNTFNLGGQGATLPSDMGGLANYMVLKQASVDVYTDYNSDFWTTSAKRLEAVSWLGNGPVVLGTGGILGSLHYPVARGYFEPATQTCLANGAWSDRNITGQWFIVDQGWGSSSPVNIDASTWFVGQIRPRKNDPCAGLTGGAYTCCRTPWRPICNPDADPGDGL